MSTILQSSHTVCSILINTPITFALQALWTLLQQQNTWTHGSTINKLTSQKIHRTIATADITTKQTVQKSIQLRQISFLNQSGNLDGSYSYILEQNNKGEVILTYQSSARRNGLAWPPKFVIEQELIWLKNALQQMNNNKKAKKGLFCC